VRCRSDQDGRCAGTSLIDEDTSAVIWLVIWLIANNVGGHGPLLLNPVNVWTATLILAMGLDLGAAHAHGRQKTR
jgi:hypothetical protein